ncbi:hypothetical protein NVP2275O_016 [Vibrio phage 2.275.O._10N.286.54.E11]|nr:hypothetical protein NVP2275O_016 [Vibrio phage 2.275.O._10N.286.54.E11]
MQPQRLFVYDNYATAVVVTGYEETENMPISNTTLKAYKGANQTVKFGIFDSDGKPWTFPDIVEPDITYFKLKVIDTRYDSEVIFKDLTLSVDSVENIQGKTRQSVKRNITYMQCTFTRSDLQDLDAGRHYKYVVFQVDSNGIQQEYMYTDIAYGVPGDFEILETAGAQFIPSVNSGTSTKWLEVTPGVGNGYENFDKNIVGDRSNAIAEGWVLYASSMYPVAEVMGYSDGLHTAIVYPTKDDGLTGVLRISGSLAGNSPQLDENQWFPLADTEGVVYHTFSEDTKLRKIDFKGNLTWIRFDLYVREYGDQIPVPPKDWPSQGHIDKILFRV